LVEEERLLMDIDRSNYSYTFEEYESDVKSLRITLSEIKNIHLIAVHRGSIPIVVHLSNLLNCEMSIIKFDTSNVTSSNKEELTDLIDEIDDEWVKSHAEYTFGQVLDELTSISNKLNKGMYSKRETYKPSPTNVPQFLSNDFKETDNLVLIEDIYDTGKTIGLIQQLMKDEYSNHSVSYYSLFGNKNDVGVVYLREKNNKWVSFPWER
jgi:hypoxanthine-guanine phosphoribosyltransferase